MKKLIALLIGASVMASTVVLADDVQPTSTTQGQAATSGTTQDPQANTTDGDTQKKSKKHKKCAHKHNAKKVTQADASTTTEVAPNAASVAADQAGQPVLG